MKPYFEARVKDFGQVMVPLLRGGAYALQMYAHGNQRSGVSVHFSYPEMKLSRADAGTFYRGCEMLANYAGQLAGKKFRVGGGGTKQEINDGAIRVWDWEMNFYVELIRDEIRVSGANRVSPAQFLMMAKMVGAARKINWWLYRQEAWWKRVRKNYLRRYHR